MDGGGKGFRWCVDASRRGLSPWVELCKTERDGNEAKMESGRLAG